MFKSAHQAFTIALIAAVIIALSGCATSKVAGLQDGITIEKVGSDSVNITHAYLSQTDSGLTLHGELKRRQHSHALIPGHLHVELLDPNGRELQTADVGYKRKGTKSHISTFHLPIPIELAPGSTIRITHYEPDSHTGAEQNGRWRQP